VTAIQLARAYTILAHNGVKIPVSLLRIDTPPQGAQVIDPSTVKKLLTMMETVIQKGGTGQTVNIPGYRVAVKTGTAKIAGVGGYQQRRYASSIVGIAPVSDPKLVVVVVINEPRGKVYYGGDVSGPAFSRVMEGTLRILDVTPDNLKSV
jgi:cell division protein FtsI (penicillin-binding protein 3)